MLTKEGRQGSSSLMFLNSFSEAPAVLGGKNSNEKLVPWRLRMSFMCTGLMMLASRNWLFPAGRHWEFHRIWTNCGVANSSACAASRHSTGNLLSIICRCLFQFPGNLDCHSGRQGKGGDPVSTCNVYAHCLALEIYQGTAHRLGGER